MSQGSDYLERILVTGGAGFIGHHLVMNALSAGFEVNILDLVDNDNERVKHLCSLGANYFQGDVRDQTSVQQAITGCTHIVHLAAQTSVPASFKNEELNNTINIEGTLNVINAAKQGKISKLILSSSAAVYGDCREIPLKESSAGHCLSPYAESKFQNEKDITSLGNDGIEAYALRFFNVYGSGQNLQSGYSAVIPSFITKLVSREAPDIYGDGAQTRDFIHVQDVASLILTIISSENSSKDKVFNVSSQTQLSISKLFSTIASSLKQKQQDWRNLEPIRKPAREGDIIHSCGDISLTTSIFDWQPKISITQGIDDLVDEYLGAD